MALANGVNANLLHKWIRDDRGRHEVPAGKRPVVIQPKTEEPAFIPVVEVKRPARLSSMTTPMPYGAKT
jgi:transposase-like protein